MMRQKAYGSDPLPLTLGSDKYLEGIREQLPIDNRVDKPINLKDIVQFAGLEDNKYKVDLSGRGDYMNYIPLINLLLMLIRQKCFQTVRLNRIIKTGSFLP